MIGTILIYSKDLVRFEIGARQVPILLEPSPTQTFTIDNILIFYTLKVTGLYSLTLTLSLYISFILLFGVNYKLYGNHDKKYKTPKGNYCRVKKIYC